MNLHAAHCDQADDGNLGLGFQLQVPNEETWQNCKRKVRYDAKGTVDVRHGYDVVHLETASGLASVPIVRYGVALKQGDEKEDNACQDSEKRRRVDYPGIDSCRGNPKQEPSKGELGRDHGQDVEEVAKPPVLTAMLLCVHDVQGDECRQWRALYTYH
jgi:hypothetical protein